MTASITKMFSNQQRKSHYKVWNQGYFTFFVQKVYTKFYFYITQFQFFKSISKKENFTTFATKICLDFKVLSNNGKQFIFKFKWIKVLFFRRKFSEEKLNLTVFQSKVIEILPESFFCLIKQKYLNDK